MTHGRSDQPTMSVSLPDMTGPGRVRRCHCIHGARHPRWHRLTRPRARADRAWNLANYQEVTTDIAQLEKTGATGSATSRPWPPVLASSAVWLSTSTSPRVPLPGIYGHCLRQFPTSTAAAKKAPTVGTTGLPCLRNCLGQSLLEVRRGALCWRRYRAPPYGDRRVVRSGVPPALPIQLASFLRTHGLQAGAVGALDWR